jgi:hypothetical protein
MGVEIQQFEVGVYRSDAHASLKQMTDTHDSEQHVTAVVTCSGNLVLFGIV